MHVRLGPAVLLIALASPAGAEDPPRVEFRCGETILTGLLAEVTAEGEFRLASGGAARLADVRIAPNAPAAPHAAAWLRSLAPTTVRLREVAPPDRWGRASAHVELTGGREPIDLGELLVSEGLAVVDPGQRDVLCRPELLLAESRARQGHLGLWRSGTWPIAASDLDRLARASGTFAVVQGRVVSVGERRDRTYLNFGRDWSRDFNVTIPRRTWAALKGRGVTAESLKGRVVTVRGTIETRRTPSLDLTVPDMLQVGSQTGSRSGGQ